MPTAAALIERLAADAARPTLARLYGDHPEILAAQRARAAALLQQLDANFPGTGEAALFSSPGRTEVGGNHTDHNAGRVLAAAINLDILAAVRPTETGLVRLASDGYPILVVNLAETAAQPAERFTSAALVRGVCARLAALGHRVGGFDACVQGSVPKGSGLSSSAAFEVLVGVIQNELYNGGAIDPVTLAQVAQYAENNYFGKPCGLMDQTTCAVGGFVTIDFNDFAHPIVKKVDFDFPASGLTLAIVDTGGDHADLNEDYAAIEHEMKAVAEAFGGRVLRQFSKEMVYENIPMLHGRVNDRAVLRALHFYDDDARVVAQVAALESGRLADFLTLVNASGHSSWMLCQNIYSPKDWQHQEVAIALATSANLLAGRGACRVHGGGFAGTIQAFVPNDLLPDYRAAMRRIYGPLACHELAVRPDGARRVEV
jgi:galactokinase